MPTKERLMSSPENKPPGSESKIRAHSFDVLTKAREVLVDARSLDRAAKASLAREHYVSSSGDMPLPTDRILLRVKARDRSRYLAHGGPTKLYIHYPVIGEGATRFYPQDQGGNLTMLFMSFKRGSGGGKLFVTPDYAAIFRNDVDLPLDFEKIRLAATSEQQAVALFGYEGYLHEADLVLDPERVLKRLRTVDFQLDHFELSAQTPE